MDASIYYNDPNHPVNKKRKNDNKIILVNKPDYLDIDKLMNDFNFDDFSELENQTELHSPYHEVYSYPDDLLNHPPPVFLSIQDIHNFYNSTNGANDPYTLYCMDWFKNFIDKYSGKNFLNKFIRENVFFFFN